MYNLFSTLGPSFLDQIFTIPATGKENHKILGGGKAALGFWPDRIGTLVSMATDGSHRVIMPKI